MHIVIRNAFITAALLLVMQYLHGPGTWIRHHMVYQVLITIGAVGWGLLTFVQFVVATLTLSAAVISGRFR